MITLFILFTVNIQAQSASSFDESLTTFQQYRLYPYLDKGTRAYEANDFITAEAELTKALRVVPGYQKALHMLLGIYKKNSRYSDAEKLILTFPGEQAFIEMNKLRNWRILNDNSLSDDEIITWTKESTDPAYFIKPYINNNIKTRGHTYALNSLTTINTVLDIPELQEFQINLILSLNDHEAMIKYLTEINKIRPLSNQQQSLICNAYLKTSRYSELNNCTESLNLSSEEYQNWYRASLNKGQYENALLIAPKTSLDCFDLLAEAISLEQHDYSRQLIKQCNKKDNPKRYTIAAQSLGLLPSAQKSKVSPRKTIQTPFNKAMTFYQAKQYESAIGVLENEAETEEILGFKAEVYEKLVDRKNASDAWWKLYQLNNDPLALDKTSYIETTLGNNEAAVRRLEYGVFNSIDKLTPILFKRLFLLYSEQPNLASEPSIKRIFSKSGPQNRSVLAGILVDTDQCSKLLSILSNPSQSTLNSANDWYLMAKCSDSDPEKQLSYYGLAAEAGHPNASDDLSRLLATPISLVSDAANKTSSTETLGQVHYQKGLTASATNNSDEALQHFLKAAEIEPENFEYQSRLGFALLSRDLAAATHAFELAAAIDSSNFNIQHQLAYLYTDTADNNNARESFRKTIDLLSAGNLIENDPLQQKLFDAKRSHEYLSRRWSLNTSGWTASGTVPGVVSVNSESGGYTETLFDYRLGKEPVRIGQSISAYGRVISYNNDRNPFGKYGGGVGLRWDPFKKYNINFFAELQNLDFGDSDTEILLRANGSFLDTADTRSDWHPLDSSWWEQQLYLDSAYWTDLEQLNLLASYTLGKAYKISHKNALILKPYLNLQAAQFDDLSDLRGSLGLELRKWAGESHYNAFRHVYKIKLEWQAAFDSDVTNDPSGIFLKWEFSW